MPPGKYDLHFLLLLPGLKNKKLDKLKAKLKKT
jgi:hypothetical protein